ncbi:flagella basal body P-ring formation protein FlgA [Paraburkholderia phenazinium]|uniref:Flagella basal body P-ring formation protein FlgA n=1 Tax=Paraburkholderia phenazinium TaxID=60549 RepID=A0A1G7PZB8_9BURK|nr:flagellar basal body P-ring formation chaperone FlgA [Paraburkholderia phenazinium]SDF91604.1 flagella basal body P-ring formation protein FlgA [Paraburkholderia phenazinium]
MARSTFDVPQPLRRIVARRTAAWLLCAVAGAWSAPAALAQSADGPIVIPGPGEQNPADLARMTQMATSSRALAPQMAPSAPATAPVTDRFTALANASGAIVIPGTGEASAPNAPTTVTAPQGAAANTAGLSRVNLNPALAASQVMPVIVTSTPPRAAYAGAVRPVNAAPAMAPSAASASNIEIDSLASRGEPPELGASAPSRAPAARNAAQVVVVNPAPQTARGAAAAQTAQAAQTTQAAQLAQAAQPVPAGQQDGETIRAVAVDFLKQQAVGLPGHVELTVAPAFPRGLAACATLQPFMPNGARMWGRTTVGVRCASGHPWTVWLQAKVSIRATYYVAARAMLPGEVVSAADLVSRDGDLTLLPMSIITDPSQAIGSVTLMRVGAGLPLRQDMLKNAAQVTAGQTVRVVAQGDGFAISSEGSALSSATPGQPVRVRTTAGQIVTGVVKDSGTVQIQM